MKASLLLLLLTATLFAKQIGVITEGEKCHVISVNNEDSLQDIQQQIAALELDSPPSAVLLPISEKEEKSIALLQKQILAYRNQGKPNAKSQGGYIGHPRDYNAAVTPQEKQDLKFIVMTLATKPVLSLAFVKSDLEAAGDRIEHLHPLKFVTIVFTDEEMKAGIQNIRTKGWVWNGFMDGMKRSFDTEYGIGNITQDQFNDFARVVGVNSNSFAPVFAKNKPDWELLVNICIKEVPRAGDHKRYDN